MKLLFKKALKNNFLDLAVECLTGLNCKVLNNYDGVKFLNNLA